MDCSSQPVMMDGPVLLVGGPYSNYEATAALLDEARRLGIPPERIVCTGDIVAYGADPVATLDLVRSSGIHVVMGNCDQQLADGAGDCGCGFPSGSACERLSAAWYAYADQRVTAEHRRWLGTLPPQLLIDIAGTRLAVIHGGTQDISRFVFASSPALLKKRELDAVDADGIIAGHCGLPFTQIVDGRLWHNPGVIGMPAHDGTPRVWFSVITLQSNGIEIAHHALDYDHATAARRMREACLPGEYEEALRSGLWPNCDVLPKAEVHAAGVPLAPATTIWTTRERKSLSRRSTQVATHDLWPAVRDNRKPLPPEKFIDPAVTAKGEPRAHVSLGSLDTLWFNTGTLCNITCRDCYIESSPKNDRLVYLTLDDVRAYLDEIARDRLPTREIGLTGGEPFMNPQIIAILDACLGDGFEVLVLTNAMKPMQRHRRALLDLKKRHAHRLRLRVSLDHFTTDRHEEERGLDTFAPAMEGLQWLAANGFHISVAGRAIWGDSLDAVRAGFASLFRDRAIPIDAYDPASLLVFPEMDEHLDVPEITTACWDILGKSPDEMMCASSRMVVKRRGAEGPTVLACTLLAYDERFELGRTLKEATGRAVPLNHPHCAKFCVLGGASCSPDGASSAVPVARHELVHDLTNA